MTCLWLECTWLILHWNLPSLSREICSYRDKNDESFAKCFFWSQYSSRLSLREGLAEIKQYKLTQMSFSYNHYSGITIIFLYHNNYNTPIHILLEKHQSNSTLQIFYWVRSTVTTWPLMYSCQLTSLLEQHLRAINSITNLTPSDVNFHIFAVKSLIFGSIPICTWWQLDCVRNIYQYPTRTLVTSSTPSNNSTNFTSLSSIHSTYWSSNA